MLSFVQKILSVEGGSLTPVDKTFVIIGDSIARGTSDDVGAANADVLYEFVSGSLLNVENDVAAAFTGSWIPAFANRLNTILGSKVNVSTNGSGGSEFSPNSDNNNWSSTGSLYAPMVAEVNALKLLKNISAFIIILGINDARGGASMAQIAIDALDLINRLNNDFPNSRLYIVQIGRAEAGVTQRVLDVRSIIDDIVTSFSNLKMCASLATFDDVYFFDNLHLSQEANDILGEQMADFLINDNI